MILLQNVMKPTNFEIQRASSLDDSRGGSCKNVKSNNTFLRKIEFRYRGKQRTLDRQIARDSVKAYEPIREPRKRYNHALRLSARNSHQARVKRNCRIVRETIARMHSLGIHTESLASIGLEYMLDSFLKPLEKHKDLVKQVTSIIILGYQLTRATNNLDVVAAGVAYWNSLGNNSDSTAYVAPLVACIAKMGYMKGWNDLAREVCPVACDHGELGTESLADSMRTAQNWLMLIFAGDIGSALRNLVLAATSMHVFQKDIAHNVIKTLGKPPAMNFISLLNYIWDQVICLLQFGENWYTTRSFFSAIQSGNPVSACMMGADQLLYYKDKLSLGLPVAGWKNVKDFINEATTLITNMDTVLTKSAPFADLREFRKKKLDLEQAKFDAINLANSSTRPVPMLVILHGTPGVGKGTIITHCNSTWSMVMGRKYEDSHMYTRVMTSQYWEMYQPFSQPIIHYSEMGCLSPGMALKAVDLAQKEVTSLCDSMPYSTDQADVGKKGTVYAHPEFVIIDTNNPTLNLGIQFMNKTAYERRGLYIQAVVKQQYRQAGGTGIDGALAALARDKMDCWWFTVTKYIAVSNNVANPVTLLSNGDIYQLTECLVREFKNHLAGQARVKLVQNNNPAYYLNPVPVANQNMNYYLNQCILLYDSMDYKPAQQHFDVHFSVHDLTWKPQIWNDYINYRATAGLSTQSFSFPKISEFVSRMRTKKMSPLSSFEDDKEIEDLHVPSHSATVGEHYPPVQLTLYERYHIFKTDCKYHWYDKSTRTMDICSSIPRFVWNIWSWSFFIAFLSIAIWVADKGWASGLFVRFATEQLRSKRDDALVRLRSQFGTISNPFETEWWNTYGKAAAAFTVGITMAVSGMKLYDSVVRPKSESAFTDKVEEEISAGTSYARQPIKDMPVWNSREHVNVPGVFRGEAAELYRAVAKNVRAVRIETDECVTSYVTGIKGSYAIINTHSLGTKPNPLVRVSYTGITHKDNQVFKDTRLDETNRIDLGNDITLLSLNYINFKDITPHLASVQLKGQVQGYFRDRSVTIFAESIERKLNDQIVGHVYVKNLLAYGYPDHKRGLCGMPLLALSDTVYVAGIHIAGHGNYGYSIPVDKSVIMEAIEKHSDGFMKIAPRGDIMCQAELQPAHPKSPFSHEFLPGIRYLGRVDVPIGTTKSQLRKSKIYDDCKSIFEEWEMPQTKIMGRPLMQPKVIKGRYISPWNLALRSMNKPKPTLRKDILNKVVVELTDRIVSFCKAKGRTLAPLTVETAIKGAPLDPFIRKMNLSTSAGFGLKGKKRDHISDDFMSPELEEQVEEILAKYRNGETAGPIYSACLKDEPRPLEKCADGRTRVFYAGSTAHLIVSRMLLSPFYSLMVEFNELFGTAVGMNTHKCGSIMEGFKSFSPRGMAGDYKSFDTSMMYEIALAVSTIIYEVCKALGFNEIALIMLMACLTDNLFPIICMLGDLFEVPGMQPSGKYGTAEDNSVRNVVMLMYAWYCVTELPFYDYNLPVTYGDDLINVIKMCVLHIFNNLVFRDICRDHFGIEYTSPDKDTPLEESVPIESVEFLKRRFVYRQDIGEWAMPLDHNSLIKALQWVMPSKVSEIEQMKSTLESVMWELAFHLPEASYTQMSQQLVDSFNDRYDLIVPMEIIPFSRIIGAVFQDEEYNLPGDGCAGSLNQPDDVIVTESCVGHGDVNAHLSKTVSGESASINRYPTHYGNACADTLYPKKETRATINFTPTSSNGATMSDVHNECVAELYKVEAKLKDMESLNLPNTHLKLTRYITNISNSAFIAKAKEKRLLLALRDSLIATIQFSVSIMEDTETPNTESALADTKDGAVRATSSEQNLMDTAGGEFWMVDARSGSSPAVNMLMGDLSLSDFLKRPVEVYSGSVTTVTNVQLDVWDLFTKSPPVRAKLRNYAFLRANLHVRVVISGTPFDYGNVMVSYQPLATYNATLASHKVQLASSAAWRPLFLNYLSQERSTCVLSVCENSPVEIVCPFVLPKPVARLYKDSAVALAAADSYPDFLAMGQLIILAMADIGSASVGANAPRIQVYAWMEDVQVSGATGTVVTITTESGLADERETGPIETVSGQAEKIAQVLSKIPVIGPYALASSIAFGALKRMAAIFGWSKPLIPDDMTYMRPEPFCNGALTIGRDSCMKVTLDPHQELTVDPRCTGTDQDEMSIAYLANKMSYFTTFNWETTDTPLSTVLFANRNTPCIDTRGTFGTANIAQPTSLRFAATPFCFWRGDLVYRFKIASNNFFRGKLAIIFEPNVSQYSLITASTALNKQYMKVIDIQETNTFDLCINWANDREWLPVMPSNIGGAQPWTTYNEYANGFIYVVPFTTLQSPNGVALNIHVFVGGRDMCFNHLSQENMISSRLTGIPGFAEGLPEEMPVLYRQNAEIHTQSGDADVSVAQPVTCMELNESAVTPDSIRKDYFGEQPLSFRSILHRYVYNRSTSVGASTGNGRQMTYCNSLYPTNVLPYGSSVLFPIDMYSYLKYAYLGMKGSIRHRVFWNNVMVNNPNLKTQVTLLQPNGGSNFTPGVTLSTGNPKAVIGGTVSYMQSVNNAIDFELPLYTNNLFLVAFSDIDSIADGVQSALYTRYFFVQYAVNDITASEISEEIATGEDFSFMRFQGAPYYSYS